MRCPFLSLTLALALLAGGSDAGTLSTLGAGPGSGAPACADPNWANVVYLVGNDGAVSGSTTFTDQSSKGHASSGGAGVQYTNTNPPSGLGTSIRLPGTAILSSANSVDWQFGSGDWTIELWMRGDSTGGSQKVITTQPSGAFTDEFIIMLTGGTTLGFSDNTSTWTFIANGAGSTTGATWQHVAAYRLGNNFYTSVAGTPGLVGTTAVSGLATSTALAIGGMGDGGNAFTGNIAGLRITKGVSRYSSGGFTPPSLPLPSC